MPDAVLYAIAVSEGQCMIYERSDFDAVVHLRQTLQDSSWDIIGAVEIPPSINKPGLSKDLEKRVMEGLASGFVPGEIISCLRQEVKLRDKYPDKFKEI